MIELLGTNKYKNDWNHIEHGAGLNAWIGKLADGSIATIQAGDWTTTPWGCGSGSLGSCNGYITKNGVNTYINQHWIQFEICDDGYKDEEYFKAVYKEAVELTAMLCKEFNIDPNGTVTYNDVKVPTILCHGDSHALKLGSNHGDVKPWFKKMGKTMDDVRADVTALLVGETKETISFNLLDRVKIKNGVTTYSSGKTMPNWVIKSTLYVREIQGEKIVVSTKSEGAITGTVFAKDLELIEAQIEETVEPEIKLPVEEQTELEVVPEVETETIPDNTEEPEFSEAWIKKLLTAICEFLLKLFKKE